MAYKQIRIGFNPEDSIDMEAYNYLIDKGNSKNKYIIGLVINDKEGISEETILELHKNILDKLNKHTDASIERKKRISKVFDDKNEMYKDGVLDIENIELNTKLSEELLKNISQSVADEVSYHNNETNLLKEKMEQGNSVNHFYGIMKEYYIKNLRRAKLFEQLLLEASLKSIDNNTTTKNIPLKRI